jgi:hypothetical protein
MSTTMNTTLLVQSISHHHEAGAVKVPSAVPLASALFTGSQHPLTNLPTRPEKRSSKHRLTRNQHRYQPRLVRPSSHLHPQCRLLIQKSQQPSSYRQTCRSRSRHRPREAQDRLQNGTENSVLTTIILPPQQLISTSYSRREKRRVGKRAMRHRRKQGRHRRHRREDRRRPFRRRKKRAPHRWVGVWCLFYG